MVFFFCEMMTCVYHSDCCHEHYTEESNWPVNSLAGCEHKSSQSGIVIWLKALAYLHCTNPELNCDSLIHAYT